MYLYKSTDPIQTITNLNRLHKYCVFVWLPVQQCNKHELPWPPQWQLNSDNVTAAISPFNHFPDIIWNAPNFRLLITTNIQYLWGPFSVRCIRNISVLYSSSYIYTHTRLWNSSIACTPLFRCLLTITARHSCWIYMAPGGSTGHASPARSDRPLFPSRSKWQMASMPIKVIAVSLLLFAVLE